MDAFANLISSARSEHSRFSKLAKRTLDSRSFNTSSMTENQLLWWQCVFVGEFWRWVQQGEGWENEQEIAEIQNARISVMMQLWHADSNVIRGMDLHQLTSTEKQQNFYSVTELEIKRTFRFQHLTVQMRGEIEMNTVGVQMPTHLVRVVPEWPMSIYCGINAMCYAGHSDSFLMLYILYIDVNHIGWHFHSHLIVSSSF